MIGVFDSGFGGLTVLRSLARLPERLDFIYLGDNSRAPYGNRPGPEIVDFTREGVEHLMGLGCRLVIVACNTASAIALRQLQRDWLPQRKSGVNALGVNVLGIIVPTIEKATGLAWSKKSLGSETREIQRDFHEIAVFATPRTVESGVYPIEIAKRRLDIAVHQEACPGLAAAIESGAAHSDLCRMVEEHVDALVTRMIARPRRVILGCTHYSLLADLFAQALGESVEIIDQPEAVAASLSSYLKRHPEYGIGPGSGKIEFLTSGFSSKSLGRAEAFWGGSLQFKPIKW